MKKKKKSKAILPDTRGRILHEAKELFFNAGFTKVSMDDLARELGMSKKTLYQYFPSKTELLDAIIDARIEGAREELKSICGNTSIKVSEQLQRVMECLLKRVGDLKPVFLKDIRRNVPEVFDRIAQFRAKMIPRMFEGLILEGQAAGEIRADVNGRIAARAILAVVQDVVTPQGFLELNLPPTEVVKQIFSLMFQGILTKENEALKIKN